VFESEANPLGTNPDGNREIFTWTASTGLAQLTFTSGVHNVRPVIGGNGSWAYYVVTDLAGAPVLDVERVHTTSLARERVAGLVPCRFDAFDSEFPLPSPPGVAVRVSAADGDSRAVFHGGPDCSGRNGDLGLEVYYLDFAAPRTLRLGPAQPTLLAWDADPAAVGFDVLRGELAALAFDGPTVDLGAATCIENDRTVPGGTYGVSSSGAPREPASGDCAL
jgi:hypothetical protein